MSNQPTDLQKAELSELKKRFKDALWKTLFEKPIEWMVWSMIAVVSTLLAGIFVFLWLSPNWWATLFLGFGIGIVFEFLFLALVVAKSYRKLSSGQVNNAETTDLLLFPKAEKKEVELLESPQLTPETRKTRAEIKGEIKEGSFRHNGMGFEVQVSIRFYNVGQPTTLMKFGLRVSRPIENEVWETFSVMSGAIGDDMPNLVELQWQKPPFEFIPGIHRDGWLRFSFRNQRKQYYELYHPTLLIQDGFGEIHEITSDKVLKKRN
jgi:hypothetical protein